jgi:hypothetical protein
VVNGPVPPGRPAATLGQVLAWHAGLCPVCVTRVRACGEYLEIAAEFTEARRVYAGPVAARFVLSVREGAAT